MTLKTQGIQYYLLDASDTGNEVRKIENVTSITGVGGTAGTIEVTNFESVAKEFVTGLKDSGTVSFGLNYDPAATGQETLLGLVGGDNKNFIICGPESTTAPSYSSGFTYPPDRTYILFEAGVQGMPFDMNTDDVWRMNCTLLVSGDYTIVTP